MLRRTCRGADPLQVDVQPGHQRHASGRHGTQNRTAEELPATAAQRYVTDSLDATGWLCQDFEHAVFSWTRRASARRSAARVQHGVSRPVTGSTDLTASR
jgi:hypothetical protein